MYKFEQGITFNHRLFYDKIISWYPTVSIISLTNALIVKVMGLHAFLNGYKFILATTEAEKEAAYRLRYQVYAESHYLPAQDDEPLLTDKYDDHSAIFIAYHKGECIGTLRLTHLTDGSNTQDYFNISLDREPHLIVDIGKFVVARRQRSNARIACYGLIMKAYGYSLQNGIEVWLGCAPQGLLRSFRIFMPSHILPQLPPTPQHYANRTRRTGYFEQYGDDIKPFQMMMSEANGLGGIINLWGAQIKAHCLKLANSLTKPGNEKVSLVVG